MPRGLSTIAEIKDRCAKRRTKIHQVVNTERAPHELFVVVFKDGTQAAVDNNTLEELQHEEDLL